MAGYPSGTNTFIPSFEASGKLQVEFSRNPKRFAVNKYIKVKPVKRDIGYYLTITAEEAARVINSNLADFVWSDGQEAPLGNDNNESFNYSKYATKRYAFPFNMGQKAVEQADWDIIASHARIAAQKAMTARTLNICTVMTTSGNWGSNTDTATNLGGGLLDAATSSTPYIKKTINAVAEAILKATIGVATRDDLIMVMNPHTASLIGQSQEIIDHLKQSPFALAQIRGDVPSQSGQWGLPDTLYGVKVVVEDAVRVTSKKGATKATTYCLPNQDVIFLTRPEGLMGSEGVPDFSTIQLFSYEDMTVENKRDPDNRRELGRVVDDYDVQLVAPASGYLVTSATS